MIQTKYVHVFASKEHGFLMDWGGDSPAFVANLDPQTYVRSYVVTLTDEGTLKLAEYVK